MEIKDKVFCSQCHHIKRDNYGYSCGHPNNIKLEYFEDTWYIEGNKNTPIKRYIQAPQIMNKNNNCPKFKPKEEVVEKPIIKKRWWNI